MRGILIREKSMSLSFCFTNNVAALSLLSGEEFNNPWVPKVGGPEGTGHEKVQSTPVPRKGTKELGHKHGAEKDPRNG